MEFTPAPPVHRVLCADCGTPITPNSANLCVACLRNTVDITDGIPKQASLSFCRGCERFLAPPAQWTIAEPESQELLAMCLKKLKGLNKVRLTDAHFVWTEPHSKRLKVSMTIQKEVLTNTVLEQVFEIEYLIQGAQCPDCAKLAAKNTWKAAVQVRQKVPHKRTFLFLEQLILKHGIQKDTIAVKEVKDGLDFFYSSRSHALKTVEFLAGVVPVRSKASEQLLSTDTHAGTANYKFTYSIEIAPICKDDLVCLPAKIARSMGNIAQLVVCTRVGNSLHFTDPATLQTAELSAQSYWRAPFPSLGASGDVSEFMVLDCEPSGPVRGRFKEADAQVALANAFRASTAEDAMVDYEDSGAGDGIYHTRTHLGALLQAGDTALGYHLSRRNFNSDDFAALPAGRIPDVVLVRKTYPNRRKKTKARGWRLKSMAKEAAEDEPEAKSAGRGVVGRMGGRDEKKVAQDYEHFLRDLEEDPEMRGAVNLYKAKDASMGAGSGLAGGKTRRKAPAAAAAEEDMDMDEPDAAEQNDGEGDPEEEDFPDVKLDELLEEFDEMTLDNQEHVEQEI